jgi:ABC-2 type transport system permease protein
MISRNSLLIADRVFRELRRDVQTMVLFTISPTFVMILISGILHNYPQTFDRVGLIVVGLFPTAPAYLFTAFAIMRDRTRGTLEYLLTSPVKKLDVLAGYLLGFTVPAVVQVALTTGVSYGLLGLKSAGPWWAVGLLALVNCALGVAIGVLAITLARNEYQLTKILIAVAVPHLMLSGLFRPHQDLVWWMRYLSNIAPWRYGVSAVSQFQYHTGPDGELWFSLAVEVGIVLLALWLSTLTVLKRRTA